MINFKELTIPNCEPLTLQEVKDALRIFDTNQDDYLTSLITACRQQIEQYLRRSLITRNVIFTFDEIKSDKILLWRAPAQSVVSFKTYDGNGNATLINSTQYYLQNDIFYLKDTFSVSSVRCTNGYEIVYSAGYGNNANDIPSAIRMGILEHLRSVYECADEIQVISKKAKTLLIGYIDYNCISWGIT